MLCEYTNLKNTEGCIARTQCKIKFKYLSQCFNKQWIFSYPGQLNSWPYQSLADVTFDFTMAIMTTMTTRKNKSLFPVHFVLIAMQLCVRAFCSPSGIEPLTLVPACLALDHKTREDTIIFFFPGLQRLYWLQWLALGLAVLSQAISSHYSLWSPWKKKSGYPL